MQQSLEAIPLTGIQAKRKKIWKTVFYSQPLLWIHDLLMLTCSYEFFSEGMFSVRRSDQSRCEDKIKTVKKQICIKLFWGDNSCCKAAPLDFIQLSHLCSVRLLSLDDQLVSWPDLAYRLSPPPSSSLACLYPTSFLKHDCDVAPRLTALCPHHPSQDHQPSQGGATAMTATIIPDVSSPLSKGTLPLHSSFLL